MRIKLSLSSLMLSLYLLGHVSQALAFKCPVEIDLKSFKKDPKAFLNSPVPKRNDNCESKGIASYFKHSEKETKNFVTIKDKQRAKTCFYNDKNGAEYCLTEVAPGQDVEQGRAPIESVDRVENLVNGVNIVADILEMEARSLQAAQLATKPWSDWYWPIYVGQLSYRYRDQQMLKLFDRSDYESEEMWRFMQNWHQEDENKPLMIDDSLLSPAEKYDILVGDNNFTLTQYMLNRPGDYSKDGKVEAWMGICHGWAPASYMLPRPVKSISVKAADGKLIEFTPTDLKALASQLWASGRTRNKFIGGRCNIENPETDPENGRIKDQKCFDNNPGTWHMAVVNQLGINQKSFVMDATYDIEVWNHPVTRYTYTYFNPETMEEYDSLKDHPEAIVAIEDFKSDKFKNYRGSETKKVVGIKMEVEYLVETMPNEYAYDEPSLDAHNTAYYTYDLELDAEGQIIGGEWYNNMHPDFLWTPYENSSATADVEFAVGSIPSLDRIGETRNLLQAARIASSKGQLIGKLIEALLEAAKE